MSSSLQAVTAILPLSHAVGEGCHRKREGRLWERPPAAIRERCVRAGTRRGGTPLHACWLQLAYHFGKQTIHQVTHMIKPYSRDLRRGRSSEPGRIYNIRTSTERRRPLFEDFWLGQEVVKNLRFLHGRGDVESLAFVVMPDHLHWLIRLSGSGSLERLMHSMKSYTAHRINQRLGVQGGGVWQAGYFDRALRKDEDLRDVARYIVLNPIRAGLCRRLGDYPLWDAIWVA